MKTENAKIWLLGNLKSGIQSVKILEIEGAAHGHRNAKIPVNEAAWLLSLQKGLVAINPFRFKGPGYQEQIDA